MLVLILGIVIFLGIHSVRIIAPDFRDRQIAAGGEGRWKGIYSVIALIGLVLIVWGYSMARLTAPILYDPPIFMRHINLLLMFFAFVFLAASQLPAGRIKAAVKHPMLLAVKIWALGHLLANGDLAALLLFGSFLAWAVVDRISVKRRGDMGVAPGPVKWDVAALVIAIVFYLLFLWRLHLWLFGVPVLP
ncbi:MAG: NnrU family protein [Rhizobiaceae bacterium]